MRVHTGRLDATGLRIAVVVARTNDVVAQRLLEGALDALLRHGCGDDDIVVAWVPALADLALAVRSLTESADAVVALGAAIAGPTLDHRALAGDAGSALTAGAVSSGVPVVPGIVVADTVEAALSAAGGPSGNRGAEAALAAVEMVSLLRTLRTRRPARRAG